MVAGSVTIAPARHGSLLTGDAAIYRGGQLGQRAGHLDRRLRVRADAARAARAQHFASAGLAAMRHSPCITAHEEFENRRLRPTVIQIGLHHVELIELREQRTSQGI
jgi:hypothetical protein